MKKTGAGRKAPAKRKSGRAGKLTLAIVTCCNLILSVKLYLLRRLDVMHAVVGDVGVKLLLTEKKRSI